MAKRKRKSRKKIISKLFPIIEGSFVLILLISIFSTSYFIFEYDTDRDNYEILHQQATLFRKELSSLKKENDDISSKLDEYSDVDSRLTSIQNDYFNHIKQLEADIQAGKTDRKIAYLTFDDGPYYNTYRVFNILDQYNVKATFFTTNINGETCYDNEWENCWKRYREYVERGHTIANHTYTHAIFRGLYSSTDSFMDAVQKQEDLVREQTGGYVTRIVRFPGGSSTAKGLQEPIKERLREKGYGWVDWNAQDGDGGYLPSTDVAWNNFVSSINENIEVILYHDYNNITIELLPQMIEYLQNNGYECYPLFYDSVMVQK